jgi:hypothetical protein
MSSVGVLMGKKKLSIFVRKKSKCPKKNFQSVKKGKKNVSVEFRVFGKKMENERKVPEKKSKCF